MQKPALSLFLVLLFWDISFAAEIIPSEFILPAQSQNEKSFEQSITISNNESTEILINKIRSSCDCIKLKQNDKKITIAPGDSYSVKFTVCPNLIGKGKFIKYIFINLQNSNSPIITAKIKGEIF